ncbi:MAG: hypothetical protein HAW62_01630 [Endozoicomonadaceae bacterium]|nr:hypothetical protein [Endozoicomonadaceae bacterium]
MQDIFIFLQNTTLFDGDTITNILLNKSQESPYSIFALSLNESLLNNIDSLIQMKKISPQNIILLLDSAREQDEQTTMYTQNHTLCLVLTLIDYIEKHNKIFYLFLLQSVQKNCIHFISCVVTNIYTESVKKIFTMMHQYLDDQQMFRILLGDVDLPH